MKEKHKSQAPERPQSRERSWRKRVKRGMAVTAMGGTVFTMAWLKEPNPVTALTTVVDMANARLLGVDYCPPAPPSAQRETVKARLERSVHANPVAEAKKQAEARGMHFVDGTVLNETFKSINRAHSAAAATSIISAYSQSTYGFPIQLKMPEANIKSAAAIQHYKDGLKMLLANMSLLPNELIQKAPIARLDVEDMEQTGYAGHFTPMTNNPRDPYLLRLDINSLKDPAVLYHEILGHGMQLTACHGFDRKDGGISGLNPPGFHYDRASTGDNGYPTVVVSSYARRSVKEDQATLAETYVTQYDPAAPNMLASKTPFADKTAVIFDRIDKIVPGSLDYLSSMRAVLTEQQQRSATIEDYDYTTQP